MEGGGDVRELTFHSVSSPHLQFLQEFALLLRSIGGATTMTTMTVTAGFGPGWSGLLLLTIALAIARSLTP